MGALLALLPILSTLIERIFPNKEEQDKAKLELQKAINEADAKLIEAKKDVIITEMNQGGFASQWRSYLMMGCTSLLIFNWIAAPVLNMFLKLFGLEIITVAIPNDAWILLQIGLGGYVANKGIDTFTKSKYGNDDKFYDILRSKMFNKGMTQEQVDVINEALKARDED